MKQIMLNDTQVGKANEINYADMYTNNLSDKTKDSYARSILQFFNKKSSKDITLEDIRSVTPEIVNDWSSEQIKKGMKRATVNAKLAALNSFYKFLSRKSVGVMDYNPISTDEGCYRYKNAISEFSQDRALSIEEGRRLIQGAGMSKGIAGFRNTIIVTLMLTTGMRRAEITDLKVGDIFKSDDSYVIQPKGKGDKVRIEIIHKDLYVQLTEYLEKRNLTWKDKNEYLFVSHTTQPDSKGKKISVGTINTIVKNAAIKAGLDYETIHPHTLRHTFATAMIENGADEDTLQKLMGHASRSTTMRYVHASKIAKCNMDKIMYDMFVK